MNKNMQTAIAIALTVGIALGLIVAVAFYFQPENVSAEQSGPFPTMQFGSDSQNQQIEIATVSTPQNQPVTFPIMAEKDGIEIEILAAQMEGNFFGADICFEFPDSNPEWILDGPDNLILSNEVQEIGVYSISLIGDLKTDDEGRYIGRCDHVQFPIPPGTVLNNLKIVVKRIITNLPDRLDCEKAQAKLVEAKSGIVIRCFEGYMTSGFDIVSMPKGMELSEAYDLVVPAFQDIVEGPWVFQLGSP